VFAARTLAEINRAKQVLRDWLAEHPEDTGMTDALEVLSHLEDFARAEEVGSDAPASPVAAT
jgi:hypothetical protein